ncbi:MAG: DUF4951 domain-containing protein [Myxococcota bacterium]
MRAVSPSEQGPAQLPSRILAQGQCTRRPIPPVPDGYTRAEFSRDVIGWGTGSSAAMERSKTVDLNMLAERGVTEALARQWAEFYDHEAKRVPQNPSARGRSVLMFSIAEKLKKNEALP